MAWVSFTDKAAFVAYHDQACAARGIPKPGKIQATGVDALGNQWTTSWVKPVLDGSTIKANVPDADVQTYKLKATTAPAVAPIGQSSTTTKTTFDAELDKTLPATWDGKPVPTKTDSPATK